MAYFPDTDVSHRHKTVILGKNL